MEVSPVLKMLYFTYEIEKPFKKHVFTRERVVFGSELGYNNKRGLCIILVSSLVSFFFFFCDKISQTASYLFGQ